jgi:hypothetical protein
MAGEKEHGRTQQNGSEDRPGHPADYHARGMMVRAGIGGVRLMSHAQPPLCALLSGRALDLASIVTQFPRTIKQAIDFQGQLRGFALNGSEAIEIELQSREQRAIHLFK